MVPHFQSIWKIVTKKSLNKKHFQGKVTLPPQKQNLLRNTHIKGKYFTLYFRRNILLRGLLLTRHVNRQFQQPCSFVNKRPFTFTSEHHF